MEKPMRKGSHTVSRLTCHIVWVTKYRNHVLKGDTTPLSWVGDPSLWCGGDTDTERSSE